MYQLHGGEGLVELKRAVAWSFRRGQRTFVAAVAPDGAAELVAREVRAPEEQRYRIEVRRFHGERLKAPVGDLPQPSRLGHRLLLLADAPRRFHSDWQEVSGVAITESLLTFWSILNRRVQVLSSRHGVGPGALQTVLSRLRELCIERPERFTAPTRRLGIGVGDVIEAARSAEAKRPWQEMLEGKLDRYRPEPQPEVLDSLTARLLGELLLKPTVDSFITRIAEIEFFGEEFRPRAEQLCGRSVPAHTWDAFVAELIAYAKANKEIASRRLETGLPEIETLLMKVDEIASGALTGASNSSLDCVFRLWREAAGDKRTETPITRAGTDWRLPLLEAPGEERIPSRRGGVLRKWNALAMKETLASDPVLEEHGMEVLLDPRSTAWGATGVEEKERALLAVMHPWFDWQRAARRPQAEVAFKGLEEATEATDLAPAPVVAAALQLQSAYDPTFSLPREAEEVESVFQAFGAFRNGRAPRSLHAWEVPVAPEPLGREILDVRSPRALSPLDRRHAVTELAAGGTDLLGAVEEYYHHYRSLKELDYVVTDLVHNLLDLVYMGLMSRDRKNKDKNTLQGNGVIGEYPANMPKEPGR